MSKHSIYIHYCDIDNIFVADIPELEGCMAHGDTPEDALREILVAKELWLEVAQEEGLEIPAPCTNSEYMDSLENKVARAS